MADAAGDDVLLPVFLYRTADIRFCDPGIQQELGLSKATLGWVSAAMLWTYALGQSVNGNLGDKYGGRRLMSLGAVLSCGLNWVVSVGTNLTGLVIPWAANGYAQSMGWAPGSRVLSNWWPHRNRGKVYGAYVFAAGMASVLAFTTSTLILEFDLSWRWIFRLPVLLLLIGGVSYYFLARDRPEDLGFPPLPSDEDSETGNDDQPNTEVADDDSSWNRYRHVLSNRAFLIASVSIGFQNLARYGLLIWVPVHFLGEDWKNSPTKWVSIALPIGMALGAMTNGWLSDRCFPLKSITRDRIVHAAGGRLLTHYVPAASRPRIECSDAGLNRFFCLRAAVSVLGVVPGSVGKGTGRDRNRRDEYVCLCIRRAGASR